MENKENNQIAERVIGVLKNALIKYAAEGKNDGITSKDTQIIIALKPDPQNGNLSPYYRVWKKMEPYMRARKIKEYPHVENTDEVTFNNILGVSFDFRGYGETAKMFLLDTFARMQVEINAIIEKDRQENHPTQEPLQAEFGYFENENDPKSYVPSMEIFIVTAQDEPVSPVPILYYNGQQIRQLDFNKDIFIMPT